MKSLLSKTMVCAGICVTTLASPVALGLSCGDTITRSVTLTEDITDCVETGLQIWQRDGIVIDLNGHTISGVKGSNSAGVMIYDSKGSKVIGGTITGFSSGVAINYSQNISVENVRFDGVGEGVYMLRASSSKITHSRFTGNFTGVAMDSEGITTGNEILNNFFAGNSSAVFLRHSNNNRVSHNTFRGNTSGIGLSSSSNNEVQGNGLFNNANAVSIAQQGPAGSGSNSNLIKGNKLYDNNLGVILYVPSTYANYSKYNRIERNAFRGGAAGVDIGGWYNYRTVISDNSFIGMSGRAVDDRGTRTDKYGNYCTDGSC